MNSLELDFIYERLDLINGNGRRYLYFYKTEGKYN
jgi:hypothetical protein